MIKTLIQRNYEHRPDVVAAVYVEKSTNHSALTNGFDALVLIITDSGQPCSTYHYSKDDTYIQERWYDRATVVKLLSEGSSHDAQQWLMAGEIVLDKQGFLGDKREKLFKVSYGEREKRLFQEFCLFLRHFLLSKDYLEEGDLLDAHSHILIAVHHWARISVIEEGCVPEMNVWKQVRKVNPGIIKLYEELTMNTETLEQRLQLAHLACDFSLLSQLKLCCQPLLRILSSRQEPWSVAELESHPDLQPIKSEVHLLLKKLASRSLIREVFVPANMSLDFLELKYIS